MKTLTLRDLYGDEVCDEVANLPFDNDGHLMMFPGSDHPLECCIIGALNMASLARTSSFPDPSYRVHRVPFLGEMEREYRVATKRDIPEGAVEVMHWASKEFDSMVLGGPRVNFVKQLLAKGE